MARIMMKIKANTGQYWLIKRDFKKITKTILFNETFLMKRDFKKIVRKLTIAGAYYPATVIVYSITDNKWYWNQHHTYVE